jgi:hypothetical protein
LWKTRLPLLPRPTPRPFYYLAAGLQAGNVRKFLLKSPAQQATARHGVAAYQAFWDELEELSRINAELLRRGEVLDPQPE